MSLVKRLALATIAGAAAFAFGPAAQAVVAVTPYTGAVSGVWSNPVLSGINIDGATGAGTSLNNSTTADCSLSGCAVSTIASPGPNSIVWGSGNFPLNHSTITFDGANFSGIVSDQVFLLGKLTYTNGTSDLASLIFGATLTLSARTTAPVGKTVDSISVPVGLVTTFNSGTPQQNADFADFRPELANSFNVLEGQTAIADVFGHIHGDPILNIDFIALDPSSPLGAGFVGAGLPLPEPGSLAVLAAGIAALGLTRRKRR